MSAPAGTPPRAQRAQRAPTIAHRLEYAALRAFLGILAPLGVRRAARVAGCIARFGYWPLGIRRGVVERQVAAAFPEFDPATVRRVAREAYDNLGRVAVEAAIASRQGPAGVRALFADSPDWAVVDRALAQRRGVAFVAGHLGNWELSGGYLAARDRMHRHAESVGFLSDQATVGLASSFVPFFGRPAKTPRGAAVFAIRADVPVVLIQALRQADGRYVFHAEDIAVTHSGDRERDVDDIVRRFSEALERLVRRHPGQYFWQHRRWKHQPADTPAHLREP